MVAGRVKQVVILHSDNLMGVRLGGHIIRRLRRVVV